MIDTTTMASPQQSAPPSLREIQRKALLRVLNLNSAEDSGALRNDGLPQVDNHEPVWKFLVFDQLGQNVISSVLRVNDLREAGVTVHMHLKANRHPMEDVPASRLSLKSPLTLVYLLEPTPENITLIVDVTSLNVDELANGRIYNANSTILYISTSCPQFPGHYWKHSQVKSPPPMPQIV